MKFFVPHMKSDADSEDAIQAAANFTKFSIPGPRVFAIEYVHNGQSMIAKVGEPANLYYGEIGPVVAILFRSGCYGVCTANRGFLRGDPILVGEESVHRVSTFRTYPKTHFCRLKCKHSIGFRIGS